MNIERLVKGSWGKIRAFFDVKTEEGFIIKGFKIIEGINGYFVGFPSQKNQDDEYFDMIIADKELKEELSQLAMQEYGGDIMTSTQEIQTSSEVQAPAEKSAQSNEQYSDDDIPF